MKKGISLLVIICTIVMLFTGCGSSKSSTSSTGAPANSGSASNKKYKIVVMPKLVGIPYFNDAENGVKKANKEIAGVEAIYAGPTKADAAEQVKMIEDYISRGVNAIAVSANDAAALTPALKKAQAAGILVLDWDSPADQNVVSLSVREIDYDQFARANWDELVKAMGTDKGDYVILTSTLTAATCNEWIEYGKKYAAEKYPNLHLVTDPVPTNESQQEAYTKSLDLIKTYPNLKGIIGFSSPAPLGAAQAVQEKGLQNTISVVGSAMPNDSKAYLKDGSMDAALLWEPSKLGFLTVYLANELLKGNKITDGMDVSGVGKISVKDKVVIMGPPTVFKKDNVDNFNF